jgi:hypothetical protein
MLFSLPIDAVISSLVGGCTIVYILFSQLHCFSIWLFGLGFLQVFPLQEQLKRSTHLSNTCSLIVRIVPFISLHIFSLGIKSCPR